MISSEWINAPSYINKMGRKWEENNIIIGYDEKSKTGIHIRFKVRSPIQDIKKYKDTRKIEKGTVCSSKSKVFLYQLANILKIELPSKINVIQLCNTIRSKLIFNEIKERNIPNSNIKWFYMYYEKQPTQ